VNISESNFRKHGRTAFAVWVPQGETVCVAFADGEKVTVGFVRPSIWKEICRAPNMADQIQQSPGFFRAYDVRIVKSGWFAFSTVDFDIGAGIPMRGKTDKGFAEFLVSIVSQMS
jgi:hypothetical protein